MAFIEKQLQLNPDQEGRIDHAVQLLTELSRSQVRGLFDHDCVKLNGNICREDFTRVGGGDVISVRWDPHHRYHEKPNAWHDPTFLIVYEDEALLVVNKAAHALSVPTSNGGKIGDDSSEDSGDSLLERVTRYLNKGQHGRKVGYPVHRLDRGVSGLLIVAKSAEVMQKMRDEFAAQKPHREYAAIVAGLVKQEQGTFKSYLATAPDLDRYSTHDSKLGQLAITHYRVDRQLPTLNATIVRVKLETGRRNQIRVHFAEAGHPVIGDPRYESRKAKHPAWNAKRLALHAAILEFEHPITGRKMRFEATIPAEMVRFARKAGDGKTPAKSPVDLPEKPLAKPPKKLARRPITPKTKFKK